MKFKIETLGCKVNSYESESYALMLKNNDYIQSEENNLDLVIINTCSVTSTSDQKCRQAIHRAIKENPNATIIVTGCYGQVGSQTIKDIDGVNIIIGSKYKSNLIELIQEYNETKKQIIKIDPSRSLKEYEEIKVNDYSDNTRAFLKIQDGCNNFCSYCLIPYTRGPSRCRDPRDIIDEAIKLTENNFKEIVLTGIDTAGYNLEGYKFTDLLKDILNNAPKLERLRISSIEESQINEEFINILKEYPKVVPHLHIPLQSGCDSVLKRMNRKYDTSFYYSTIEKIRRELPDICITTDVIVGFPGETEEEFNITYDFIKKVNFSMLHVFPYSRRSGTVADKMSNQIDSKTKKERVRKLIELSNKQAKEYISKFKNKQVNVLFETVEGDYVIGHAENYFRIKCLGNESMLNSIKEVEIIEPNYPESIGVIIK